MAISNLQELFNHKIQDLHSAETQIIAALPKLISKSTDGDLTDALEEHLEVTQTQLARLEDIMAEHELEKIDKLCVGMEGIIEEGEEILGMIDDPLTRDAAIIAAAQSVEHYEISVYGTALQIAKELGYDDSADLLEETLDEEYDADKKLTSIAEGGIFKIGINEAAKAS